MTAIVCGFMSGAVRLGIYCATVEILTFSLIIDCLYLDFAPKLVSLEKFGEKINPQKDGNSAE